MLDQDCPEVTFAKMTILSSLLPGQRHDELAIKGLTRETFIITLTAIRNGAEPLDAQEG
jgi:hypothetical protein